MGYGESPLSQREIVAVGFDPACPDLVLGGLGSWSHLINHLQSDWHFISLGKRRMRFPPFVEFDGINLILAWLNNKCGRKVHREHFLLLRKYKLPSVFHCQLE